MTTNRLIQKIRSLDEPTVLEAAQLLGAAIDATPTSSVEDPIMTAPLEHRAEVAEVCRLLLTVAATDSQTSQLVAESIDGAGRKQLVLGGFEIVALAALALGALQTFLSKGRTAEEEVMTMERHPDGSETMNIRKTVTYGLSAQVGELVRIALGSQSAGGPETAAGGPETAPQQLPPPSPETGLT